MFTKRTKIVEFILTFFLIFRGVNNVIGYKGTVRNHDHSAVILPYFPHDKFQVYNIRFLTYFPKMKPFNLT